jgi:hypothetical protein
MLIAWVVTGFRKSASRTRSNLNTYISSGTSDLENLVGSLVIALQRNLRRIRAVIADAPRTEEWITHAEVRKAMPTPCR